jgi:hypothetical protein
MAFELLTLPVLYLTGVSYHVPHMARRTPDLSVTATHETLQDTDTQEMKQSLSKPVCLRDTENHTSSLCHRPTHRPWGGQRTGSTELYDWIPSQRCVSTKSTARRDPQG